MSEELRLGKVFEKIHADYTFLLSCFREVLTDLGHPELAACVPGNGNGHHKVDPDLEMHVLSVAFQLLNLVEENTTAQGRRSKERDGEADREPGLWRQNLRQLNEAGFTPEQIAAVLKSVHVEPVLTAHPTESKRTIVLIIHRELYLQLVALENQMWTKAEREEIVTNIKALLERLWRTGEIHLHKPDVSDERANVLYYLRRVFPEVLTKLDQRLRQAWRDLQFSPELIADPEQWPRLNFGNWVGGDRDGHPLVTDRVTRETLETMRSNAWDLLDESLSRLASRLSLSSVLQPPPARLLLTIDFLEELAGADSVEDPALRESEPWSHFVNLIRARVAKTFHESGNGGYDSPAALARDLVILRETLVEVGGRRLAEVEVNPVERLVHVFGFHMARLDVRQNSSFHDRAIEQLLVAAGFEDTKFSTWPEEKRLAFLEKELRSPRPFAPRRTQLAGESGAVLACYELLADHHDKWGTDGLGSLIVSMTRSVSDLLAVYLLAREAGLARDAGSGLTCLLPVVPLFETVDDLRRAPEILRAFLEHPVTSRTLALQGVAKPVVSVMVGYSDSNKDGGILAAQWHVNRVQLALSDEAKRHNITLQFFHGRGGTVSRGAGPTHRFMEALPHGSLAGEFRLTEQGETIAQKYANLITATYNLELLMAGVTATTIKHAHPIKKSREYDSINERLSEFSRESYRQLLSADRFMEYWAEATPIDALEASSIGSRPARRTGRRTMEDLRAIPWVFSWNQSRHYVPGWYGIGTALQRLRDEDPSAFEMVQSIGVRWPFLRFVLLNAETSLASAHLGFMSDYASLVRDSSVRNRIYEMIAAEYRLSESMINELYHAPRETRRPRMIETIRIRDEGLRVLHRMQIGLLRDWRAAREDGDDTRASKLLPSVLLSVNAIASGLRTTG